MDEQPDGTNPLLFTTLFVVGLVVVVALVYGFIWLMWAGN